MATKEAGKSGKRPVIGFVGQGFVGKSYADDFEKRGFSIIRYSLEEPYKGNKEKIKDADIVFVCVPTPSKPAKKSGEVHVDLSIVEESFHLAGAGKIAVIKSTMPVGATRALQKKFPKFTVLFSPEFLNAATAAKDAAHPFSNIIGLPVSDAKHKNAARIVHNILPKADFSETCSSEEAELYKYAHNVSGFMQVLTYNLVFDIAKRFGAEWQVIQKALEADPMVSNWYIRPVDKKGRGAGGPCFIKDFAAFRQFYERYVGTAGGVALLKAAEKHNIALLASTGKDLDLLWGVYGKRPTEGAKKSRKR